GEAGSDELLRRFWGRGDATFSRVGLAADSYVHVPLQLRSLREISRERTDECTIFGVPSMKEARFFSFWALLQSGAETTAQRVAAAKVSQLPAPPVNPF